MLWLPCIPPLLYCDSLLPPWSLGAAPCHYSKKSRYYIITYIIIRLLEHLLAVKLNVLYKIILVWHATSKCMCVFYQYDFYKLLKYWQKINFGSGQVTLNRPPPWHPWSNSWIVSFYQTKWGGERTWYQRATPPSWYQTHPAGWRCSWGWGSSPSPLWSLSRAGCCCSRKAAASHTIQWE